MTCYICRQPLYLVERYVKSFNHSFGFLISHRNCHISMWCSDKKFCRDCHKPIEGEPHTYMTIGLIVVPSIFSDPEVLRITPRLEYSHNSCIEESVLE